MNGLFRPEWSTLKKLIFLQAANGGSAYATITGNPVSFSAKAAPLRQLKVAFSPVQSLNGYDAPWPAGGGKNKCDGVAYSCEISYNIARVLSTTPISSPFVTTSNYAGAGFIAPVKAGQAYALSSDVSGSNIFYWAIYANLDDITDRAKVLQSGSTSVTFTADYDGYVVFMRENHPTGQTVTWTYAQLELGSSATSYAPYSNECPISGWSSLTVEQRGRNLIALPIVPYNTVYPYSSINTFDPADYMWLKAGTYCLSYIADASNRYLIKLFDKNGNALGDAAYNPAPGATYFNTTYKGWYTGTNLNAGAIQRQIVLIEDCYVRICRSFGNPDISFTDCQLELGSTASPYQPYNPSSSSISISLGETVYSGYVDVVTGVVKARPYYASYNGETLVGPWMSSMDKYAAGATPTAGAQVVDMGGAETTIQLTPQEVESLAGDNNLWSDANQPLTVTYRSN